MSVLENVKSHAHRAHRDLAHSPLIVGALGVGTLGLWGCASIVQIQTSEFMAQGATSRVAGVAWNVLGQPTQLIMGNAPIQYVTAWTYGWGVELFTLVFALALTVSYVKIGSLNSGLAKGFVACSFVMLALNSYADFASSPGSNGLIRFCIALCVGLLVSCGLPLGVGLIEYALEQY